MFTIRPATRADLPDLGRLGAMLLRAHHNYDPKRFMAPGSDPEGGYAWFLGTQLKDDDSVVLVAEQDGRVVGYVYASLEPQSWKELRDACGFVHDVAVAAEARRHGVAAALFDKAIEWLKGRGAPRVVLWSAEGNAGAQRLFEKLGFRRTMVEMTKELD